MPEDPSELLAEGVRAERAGALERALETYQSVAFSTAAPLPRAEAFTRIADVRRERCEWDEGIAAAREGQQLAQDAGLTGAAIEATIAEANILMCRGDFAAAMALFQEIAAKPAEARVRGVALQNIASMLAQLGRFGEADRAFRESLGYFQQAGYRRGEVIALNNIGRLALDQKRFTDARPLLERAVESAKALDDGELIALASENLAMVFCEIGDVPKAEILASSALGYFVEAGNRWRQIECLRLLGGISERQKDPASARRCYERALLLAEEINSPVEIRVTRHRLDSLTR